MSAAEIYVREFRNQGLANFSLEQDRKKMAEAVERVRAQLGRSYRLGDGAVVESRSEAFVASFNPSRKTEVVGFVEFANLAQAQAALEKVYHSRDEWARTPVAERAAILNRVADWFEQRRWELSAWMVFEVGKTWREADADVCEAIDFCRYYAQQALALFEPKLTQAVEGEKNILSYQARGVSLVIAPWNFPLAILTGMAVASLVTGNTVLIKPAEQSPVIASFLAQALKAAGLSDKFFHFLPGVGEEIGPSLVQDPRVDMIVFTGSADVGFQIIESASRRPQGIQRGVKKVVAELGGKNALIIDQDADPDEAVLGAIHSAFGFQGQKCSALSRLLVHEKIYDQFVSRFVEAAKSLQLGPSDDPQYQMGPVIDEEAQQRILKTIEAAASRLPTLLYEKSSLAEGFYVAPAIFEVSDRNDEIFQNEIFGPVVAVKKVKDLDEALEDANSVKYALTGGVYSRSPSSIERVKREFEVGNLYINRSITGAIVERQPFGGFKYSGIGSKAGGPDYLLQFVEPRCVTENTVRRGFAGE